MVKSMTGYGRCDENINGRDIVVEIKSVNHRYFEFSARVSRGYGFLEDKLKKYVQSKISRGKVDMYVSIGANDNEASVVEVNHSLAEGYINAMREIAEKYDLPDDISVTSLSRYNDIFTVHKAPEDEEQIWQTVLPALDKALESFINMRINEGKNMFDDISSRSETILQLVSKIEERSPQTVIEYRKKLQERIEEMLADTSVDEQRLLTETAIFADKVAVAEETVRLRSHFAQLDDMLKSDIPVGRKIDFLVQEMNRETNTIGSKAVDSQIAYIVVDIKAELEKIREQIQNIE
ncbi:MAG: YicC/YloC family endoribonuclease [Acutalibacteraceae bacterium]